MAKTAQAPVSLPGPCDDGQKTVIAAYQNLGFLERERLYNFAQDALKRDADPAGYQARDYESIEFLALFVADTQEASRADDSQAAHAAALQWQGITATERARLFDAWETIVSIVAVAKARGMRPVAQEGENAR